MKTPRNKQKIITPHFLCLVFLLVFFSLNACHCEKQKNQASRDGQATNRDSKIPSSNKNTKESSTTSSEASSSAAPVDSSSSPPSSTASLPPPERPLLSEDQPCNEPKEVALFVAPRRPMAGQKLRIMIVSDNDIPNTALWARSPDGEIRQLEVREFHGPPHAWSASIDNPSQGTWRVALSTHEGIQTCEDITTRTVRPMRRTRDVVWPVFYRWDRSMENLYSAWIMQLFHSDPSERPSWSPLHEVFRDPERNWLYNRLGMNEDGPDFDNAIRATPDCADTPYYLRAYFAWKMRLLFIFSSCSRGRRGEPPRCNSMMSNLDPPIEGLREAGVLPEPPESEGDAGENGALPNATPSYLSDSGVSEEIEPISEVIAFNQFMNRVVIATAHSGSGRLLPNNNRSDLYSIELSRESIRPGTIFVDPYGHLLVISQWIDQTEDSSGMLFAIDGHPDLSIGRKRFWRGAFLFLDDLSWGAGGFKAFRPVFLRGGNQERIHRLSNSEIDEHPDYGNFSDEQYRLGLPGFYERMNQVINPNPLEPVAAQQAMLEAFYELVQERVDSVAAGESYQARRGYSQMSMPEGGEIFETSGAWEDFSTPARDFRLLIAIDLVKGFPQRVISNPGSFSLHPGQQPPEVAQNLRRAAQRYLENQFVSYTRSDGSEQRLSLAAIVTRQEGLEMGYNPNDCIEIRWAAPDNSPERSTCQRRAPEEQLQRMKSYRSWFKTRIRPPRQ